MTAEPGSFPQTPLPDGPSPGLGDLQAMYDEIASADAVFRPSSFWQELTEEHLQELNEDGFDRFKRTINRRYFQFQFISPFNPEAFPRWAHWLKRPRIAPLRAKFVPGHELELPAGRINNLRAKSYAKYIALLAERVREKDTIGLLERLDEPLVGDPVCIEYGGRRVSEDLCNSALEVLAVVNEIPEDALDDATAIELGSGYGRLAWAYMTAFPSLRYVLVDIPAALAVAEQYLTSVLPERRVFAFRHFDSADEVADELAEAQLVFLTPNQLELLPQLKAQLFVNVSSLHEMTPAQIERYFELIDQHTEGWFYTKQWISSVNAADDLVYGRDEYPVRERWRTVFDRTHAVNSGFFEALYDLRRS
jgi:putative sugar O-methyltransferase